MANPQRPSLHFGGVEFGTSTNTAAQPVDPQTPFRILLLADFSGRGDLPVPGNGPLKIIPVDRDNFDDLLQQLAPSIPNFALQPDGSRETLTFKQLEDFEPDHLYETLGLFEKLRTVRRRLLKPQTFAAAAAEVRSWLGQAAPASTSPPPPAPAATDPASLLDQSLDLTQQEQQASSGGLDVEKLVRDIIRPYLQEKADPQQAELVATVDALQAELMRKVLHAPAFQSLEATWRGLQWLVRRLETGRSLQLHLLDISRAGVLQDFTSVSDLRQSRLWKTIVDGSVGAPGAKPWSLLLGNYPFEASEEDALLARCLATLAAQARAPFIASGAPSLYGALSVSGTPEPDQWNQPVEPAAAAAWAELRQHPSATSLGLVSPRFLLRYPYDPQSVRIETISFEEIPRPNHESYLWASGAFIVGLLLAETFQQAGWKMQPRSHNEVSGLPVHVYQCDGESVMTPCAEACLTTRAVEKISQAGLMPLVSLKNQDKVRLQSFQSLAQGGQPLAGRWT